MADVGMGLEKVRKLVIARHRDNEFMFLFVNAKDEVVSALDPQEVFIGETYEVDLGHDIVIGVPRILREKVDTIL